jgi:alkanesulfonate monooxygenase SsuD/methylene tetrahydromethanopterin reductase-like flavin-dependent oxidoreductase (luciferase family)
VKFGVFPAVQATRLAATADEALRAEEQGFDSVWIGEHHGRTDQCPSPLLLLSHVAARTRRLRLGTGSLLVPLYHPVRLAAEIAMLQDLSGGRALIGVSPGYVVEEFAAFGLTPDEKVRRFVDGLGAVRRQLAGPGRPEFWLGVGGPKLIARAVEMAERFYIGMPATMTQIHQRIALYRGALEAAGQRFVPERVAVNRLVLVTDDNHRRETALARATQILTAQYRRYGNPDALAAGDPMAEDGPAIVGTPDECVARLRRLQALGVGYVIADMHCVDDDAALESMRLFAARVMPHFN